MCVCVCGKSISIAVWPCDFDVFVEKYRNFIYASLVTIVVRHFSMYFCGPLNARMLCTLENEDVQEFQPHHTARPGDEHGRNTGEIILYFLVLFPLNRLRANKRDSGIKTIFKVNWMKCMFSVIFRYFIPLIWSHSLSTRFHCTSRCNLARKELSLKMQQCMCVHM